MGQCTSYMKRYKALKLHTFLLRIFYVNYNFRCGYISTDGLKFDRNIARHLNTQTHFLLGVSGKTLSEKEDHYNMQSISALIHYTSLC